MYLGLVDSGPTGEWLRRRIDWIADEVRGPRVLDVGCGDGILEVLLARRGLGVTGVDIDSNALDFARQLIETEPDEVRSRVELVNGDFMKEQPVNGLFDTVVLGELLNHLDDPGVMLDRVLEHLRPGGRVVVTTPFGSHPREDHGSTFYLTHLIKLLKPRLEVESLCVEDNHIRFVGHVSKDSEASWQRLDGDAVLSMTEAAFVESRKHLIELIEARGTRIERLQQRLKLLMEKNRSAQVRVNADNKKLKDLEFRSKLDQLAFRHLKEQFGARTRDLNASAREVRTKEQEIEAKKRELGRSNLRLQMTRSSTSFGVGSAFVDTARKPLTSWKLPFKLLRLYRSKSMPQPAPLETAHPEAAIAPPTHVSDEPEAFSEDVHPDPSRFIDFPLPPIPKAKTAGPPVAAILDTFSEYSLRHEVNLLSISPKDWLAELEKTPPACLFVESAWSGNNGQWRDLILGYDGCEDNPLTSLLKYCRSRNIPTIFWNKEDPTNYHNFLGAARRFDFVFTSDEDCVPRYKEELKHGRIFVLPFAAQPIIHNPSRDVGWPSFPVCFPGSWAPQRYPGRAETLRNLLDPAMQYGLHVFDRNLARIEIERDYRFPDRYKDTIRGTLTYEEMLTAYRCYDVMLNVNTVIDSPTMFSRRVFESLACATPVISSESEGMNQMLGEYVRVTRSMDETKQHLEELLGDEEARVREGHLAYRYVHENHTYRHRMNEVFNRVGLEPLDMDRPSVSVLTPTMRPQNVTRCLDNFKKQAYQNRELILILNNAEFDLDAVRREAESIPNVQVLHVEGRTTLGDCLNRGVEAASGRYVAEMDDGDYYGERYLSDSVLAASFSEAEIVGKGMYYVYFESTETTALREITPEHAFTSATVAGNTIFIQADVARDVPFASLVRGEDTDFQRRAIGAGCRIYSTDRFNYLRVWDHRLSERAWNISDAEFRKKCHDFSPGLHLARAMI